MTDAIAVLAQSDATAKKKSERAFHEAKWFVDPDLVARAGGDGLGNFELLRRDYTPIEGVRIPDTPAVRALAVSINENGIKFPEGVRVSILEILTNEDSRATYRRRIQALLEVVR